MGGSERFDGELSPRLGGAVMETSEKSKGTEDLSEEV